MIVSNYLHKGIRAISNPRYTIYKIMRRLSKWCPCIFYIKATYYLQNGQKLNLKNPQTFNEKLNWMKIHLHDSLFTRLADKYEVKEYIAQKIGSSYVVPTLGIWNNFEEIDFNALPNEFILKATHNSGGIVICHDKKTFDKETSSKILKNALKQNWYYTSCEWVYKGIRPRILADTLLKDKNKTELQDYKFWCFNGEPKIMYITNKGKNIYENFYDMNFNPININHGFPRMLPEYSKPNTFEGMRQLATTLSKNIPFVRIDFFDIDGHIYFGEFTFYDWGGMRRFKTKEEELMLGSWIDLSSYFKKTDQTL
ncbi:MAG: glycosyl transferase [Prevotella sp.]|nr:glycosyl transferase [Candidatus Equicola faecalis]